MKAALPSGLKLESEAFVVLPKDRVADDEADETEDEEGVANNPAHPPVIGSASLGAEQQIFCALADHKPQSIEQLQKTLTGVKGVLPALRRLIESGEITVQERLSQGFVAKKETHVRLAEKYRDNETAQHFLLDSLRRSERQKEVVMTLIEKADCLRSELNARIPGAAAALAGLKKKGVVELLDVVADRLKTVEADPDKTPSTLSKSQSAALADINAAFEKHDVCLLHGVTSSGKTEVYTELINHTLAAGKQVLYLVPEIALTTQLTERLGRVFGEKMGVYHSKFPDAERVEMWQRQLSPRAFPLIVGVRSSLFLPFQNLGLVIVDEEHETSYKQQDPAPRYNARDTAIVLAQKCGGAKVLLGTATPALETYFNATRSHKYGLSTLTERFGGVNMPETAANRPFSFSTDGATLPCSNAVPADGRRAAKPATCRSHSIKRVTAWFATIAARATTFHANAPTAATRTCATLDTARSALKKPWRNCSQRHTSLAWTSTRRRRARPTNTSFATSRRARPTCSWARRW